MGKSPRLLLHSCCAPCSSAVLESVFRYFEITVFYYNPNIFPKKEYLHRVQEQKAVFSAVSSRLLGYFFRGGLSAGTVLSACTGTGTGTGRRRKMRPLLRAAAAPHRRAGQRARFFRILPQRCLSALIRTRKSLTPLAGSSLRNTRFLTYILILKRRTAISVPSRFPGNMGCTGRSFAAAPFPGRGIHVERARGAGKAFRTVQQGKGRAAL